MSFPTPDLLHLYSYAETHIRMGAPANGIALAVSPIETPEGNGFHIHPSGLRMPILALRDLLGKAFGRASTFPSFSLKVLQTKTDERLLLRSTGIELAGLGPNTSREDAEEQIFNWVLQAARYTPPVPHPVTKAEASLDFKG